MNSLNPQQQAAVRYIDGPLLVLAGAGSGKTSVITRKIAWLISGCEIPARHIAAVTFTNKAAREMKQRVGQLLPAASLRGLTVSTFHHLGLQILRKEIQHLDRKRNFSIVDQQDCGALLKEILLDHGDGATQLIDLCQQQISHWKNEGITPVKAQSLASSAQEQRIT
ncbi:UvrD-helicase domain-containing protein, partial [bacterium]|nr:UvrD-helicase domain-containing protein [bacterium]